MKNKVEEALSVMDKGIALTTDRRGNAGFLQFLVGRVGAC